MPPIQDSYRDGIQQGEEGLLYDLADHEALGRTAEASAIRYGAAVVQGTNDNQCRLPDSADVLGAGAPSTVFLGISVREHVREIRTALATPVGAGQTGYVPETDTVSVATSGRVWVKVEQNVAAGDPVFYRHAAGAGGAILGSFRKDADTATAVQVSGAKYLTSALSGGFAVVQL